MKFSQAQQDALNQITGLAHLHTLSAQDISEALHSSAPEYQGKASLLQTVLIYIGAAFIFCGICTYVSMVWDSLDSLARVIITLGSGFVTFVLGLITLRDAKFIRASTPLFLIAAALQPSGLFVFMHEYLPPSGDIAAASCLVFGFMLIQQGCAFYATKRTSLLFFTLFFFYMFLNAAMEKAGVDSRLCLMTLGLSGLMITSALNQTRHQAITPFYFFVSGASVYAAAFDYLERSNGDVLLIGLVAGLTFLSVRANSRSLLTVSIFALLGYLIYFTEQYFQHIVGWPIALVLIGLIMIGAGSYAVKLGHKMKSAH